MKDPAANATDAPQPWRLIVQPCEMMKIMRFFLLFHFNGAPVEWDWQGKTEVNGQKSVPVPLYPPEIPHGPTRDRTRTSALRGLRLTAWAMARPKMRLVDQLLGYLTTPSQLDLCWRHHQNGCGAVESYRGSYRVGREAVSLVDCCVWLKIGKLEWVDRSCLPRTPSTAVL
jgi:hypothetical protein